MERDDRAPARASEARAQLKREGVQAVEALTDEELVRRYQRQGDRRAVELLVARHLGPVRALLAALVLDEAAAEDLCQEVFLRALRGLDRFAGRAAFSTWLHRIALNTAYAHLRQRRQASRTFGEQLSDPPDRRATPDEAAMGKELAAEIEAALSPKLRAAIVLTCLQPHSVAEAATIEGCTRATMHWRVFQARSLLRRRLRKYLEA